MVDRRAGEGRKLQDALVFSVIEKLTKGPTRHLEMGKYLLSNGKLDSAELCFDQAIREARDEKKIAIAGLIGKSEVQKRRKQFEEAYGVLSSAQELAAELDPKLQGLVYQQQAEVASAEGHWAIALDKLKEAKEAFSLSEQETASEMVGLAFKMGMAAGQLLRFGEALAYYEEAEELARKVNNGPMTLLATLGQTDALSGLGRAREAIERCDRAEEFLRLHREELKNMNVKAIQVRLLEKRAGSYQTLGHLDKAAHLYKEALESSSDPKEVAKLHSTLAVLKFSMGSPEEAREHEGEAKEILEESEGEVPEVLFNLSKLNLLRGQISVAEKEFFRALVELPDRVSKGQGLAIRAHEVDLNIQQGQVNQAQELAHVLYHELAALDIEPLLPSVLNTLGNIARLQDKVDEAEGCYQKSLKITENLGMPLLTATALRGLAQVAAARSEISAALGYLDRALQLSRECRASLQEQALLLDRAAILSREDGGSKIAVLEELLRDSRRFESLSLELAAQTSLAMIHWQEAHYPEARHYLEDAMEKAAEAGMEFIKILVQGLLGLVLSDLGEERLAERYLEDALGAMEMLGLEIEAKHQFQERYRDLTGFWF